MTLILVALPLLCWGQGNLVPNGGFETYSQCPWGISQIENATPWTNVGGPGTPDYFHRCAPPLMFPPDTVHLVGVAQNIAGVQEPFFGDGYAGIYVYNGPVTEEVREYIQVELLAPIAAGVRYEVSFYISLADNFQYAISSLGAYFSAHRMITDNWGPLDVLPQIESPEDIIYCSKDIWMQVRDTFSSRYGDEKWLIIGNFRTDGHSNIFLVDSGEGSMYSKSYYYIDDVSVIALDSIPNSIEETERLNFTVFPNPAIDVLYIRSKQRLARVRLMDISGRAVYAQDSIGRDHTVHLHDIPTGLYLVEVWDTEGRSATRKVVVQ